MPALHFHEDCRNLCSSGVIYDGIEHLSAMGSSVHPCLLALTALFMFQYCSKFHFPATVAILYHSLSTVLAVCFIK